MNQLPERISSNQIDSSSKKIRLEYDQAFRLLDTLENLSPNIDQDLAIEQLRNDLDDACWLAQWKREYVSLDDAIIAIPQLSELVLFDRKE